jgi:hypothetical protein
VRAAGLQGRAHRAAGAQERPALVHSQPWGWGGVGAAGYTGKGETRAPKAAREQCACSLPKDGSACVWGGVTRLAKRTEGCATQAVAGWRAQGCGLCAWAAVKGHTRLGRQACVPAVGNAVRMWGILACV